MFHVWLRIGTWFWDRKPTSCRHLFSQHLHSLLSSSGGMVLLREVTPVGGKFIGKTWLCIQWWLWVDSLLKRPFIICVGYMYIYIYIASINMAHIGYVMISNDTCFVWIKDSVSLPSACQLRRTHRQTPADTVSSGKRYLRLANQGCHIVPPRQING